MRSVLAILKDILSKINILNKNKIEIVKIWQNASPTSSFAAQSITVSGLSDYDEYEIIFGFHVSLNLRNTHKSQVGYGILLAINDVSKIYRRNVTASGNTLTFSTMSEITVESTASVEDNNYLIPIAIYGIKGVQ